MVSDLIFYAGIALLITHELDAIQRHEWRIFPFICRLRDDVAYHVFVILHVPLLVLLLWLISHPSENVRFWFQVTMDVFFIVHMGLHSLLKNHKMYEFKTVFSRIIIILIALVGLVHLVLLISQNNA